MPEDEKVGTTILQNIEVEDKDFVGDGLEVACLPNEQVNLFILLFFTMKALTFKLSKN